MRGAELCLRTLAFLVEFGDFGIFILEITCNYTSNNEFGYDSILGANFSIQTTFSGWTIADRINI